LGATYVSSRVLTSGVPFGHAFVPVASPAPKGSEALGRGEVQVHNSAAAPSPRRSALLLASALAAAPALMPNVAVAGGIDAARAKLTAAVAAVDRLVDNWGLITKGSREQGVSGGGDKVLTILRGSDSPLFKIQQAMNDLAPAADDPEAYTEALEAFLQALASADGAAYSSNFAGGSGDPRKNSPTALLAKAKEDVLVMRKEMGNMVKALGPAAMS